MRSSRSQPGFTLIELILVVAIIGIAAAVTIPNLVKSIRGNRLRMAARTVVMAGRYARSMAVLRQKEMALFFDFNASQISVLVLSPSPTSSEADDDSDGIDNEEAAGEAGEDDMSAGLTNPPPSGAQVDLRRDLDGVSIEFVETQEGAQSTEGTASVLYYSNGRCTPYTVKLVDEEGETAEIKVDALSSAETEMSTTGR